MISKIRHQTCQINDFHTECYMGGGVGVGVGDVRLTIWSQTVENREKLMF